MKNITHYVFSVIPPHIPRPDATVMFEVAARLGGVRAAQPRTNAGQMKGDDDHE